MSKTLILSPGLLGPDGIASATRQVVRAIRSVEGGLDIFVLCEARPSALPAWLEDCDCAFAEGDKLRFVRDVASAATLRGLPWQRVLSMHVNVGVVAAPLARLGLQHTIFLHSFEVWGRVSPLRKLVLRYADLLVSNSAYTAERFRREHPFCDRGHIKACLLGVSESEAVPPLESTAHARPFALVVGRMNSLEGHKGHDLLLELWAEAGADLDLDLVVAGDGDDRPRLERKAQSLGLGQRVRFAGRVDDAQLSALYRDCLFFAMPGRDEGFGLVYIEAMRLGKPVIAGPGAPEEIVVDGECGYVIDPSRRADVLAAMRRLAGDAALRARLGAAARARVAAHFTEGAFRARFLRVAGY